MQLQKWRAIRGYTSDYLNLVYKYYASAGISYICTYYNFDFPNSTIDKQVLDAGAYETTGKLSGNLWRKILYLPVYNVEQVSNPFISDERGHGKFDQASSMNIPTIYGIQPSTEDYVIFEEIIMNDEIQTSDNAPVYQVSSFEKATNTDVTFWKLGLIISQASRYQLDSQLSGNYTFIDYEKQIYKTTDALVMYNLMERNRSLGMNDYFNQRFGFYLMNK